MGNRYDFDVAVVGGGPGGYPAAIRAAQLGARACVIEKGHLGGVCTNAGCIPTKVLVHAARLLTGMQNAGQMGVRADGVSLDFAKVAKHRDKVVSRLRDGVRMLLEANKVALIRAEATFKDAHVLQVKSADGEDEVSASRIFVATGSQPVELPAMKFDGETVLSSTEVVNLDELPQSIVIVGGGYIGCEFASCLAAFGVEITIVEALDRLLPLLDEDCARAVTKGLKGRGVVVRTSAKVETCKVRKDSVVVRLSDGSEIEAQKALVCVGRKACTAGLNLEAAGLEAEKDGSLSVNEHMQTARPHIYAIGDVTGRNLLAHVASRQAVVAAAHATGTITAAMDYRVVPACVFTNPEVATVGLTEQEAEERFGQVVVRKFPFRALGKAHIEGDTGGFVKMVAAREGGEVLGVHIAGPDASSLIAEAALGMQLEATAAELAETIHAHPTMPEALKEAAEGILDLPIHWTI